MANIEEKTNPLADLYAKVAELAVYGDNAVLRRALTIIGDAQAGAGLEAGGGMGILAERQAFAINCRPCNGPGPRDRFPSWVHETQQDDRRRSVFLDPEESLVAHLVDYYSGRLNVLEVRNADKRFDLEEIESKAIDYMRGRVPIVSINHFVAESDEEIIQSLRTLADLLEKGVHKQNFESLMAEYKGDVVTLRESCAPLKTDVIGTRWTNNGRTLEQGFRETIRCTTTDHCCGNTSYHDKPGREWWQTIWQDGNVNNRPPQTPPNFASSPWDNRIPVLDDPQGTRLESDWGWRNVNGAVNFHGGIDIAAPVGRDVTSVTTGRVIWINSTGAGNDRGVVVRTGNQTHTYWHINPSVSVGDTVNPGDIVGSVAPGAHVHVHYAIHRPPNPDDASGRNDGNSVNPLP